MTSQANKSVIISLIFSAIFSFGAGLFYGLAKSLSVDIYMYIFLTALVLMIVFYARAIKQSQKATNDWQRKMLFVGKDSNGQ